MSTNSSSNLSEQVDKVLLKVEAKGYEMAKKKNCKDPISGYLPGTPGHRAFMRGWNRFVKEHTNKERNNNANAG